MENNLQIRSNSKELQKGDIINENSTGENVEIIGDPRPCIGIQKSRWKIVNWWRKLTKTQKLHTEWVYTVKLIKNNKIETDDKHQRTIPKSL